MNRTATTLAALIALATGACAVGADLLVRAEVVPQGPVLRLGEVAEVLRATPAEQARLAALPLMPAPAPGTQETIRAQDIRNLLVAAGIDLNDVRFDGATRITVGYKSLAPPPPAPVAEPSPEEPETFFPQRTVAPSLTGPKPRRQPTGYRLVAEAPPRPIRGARRISDGRHEPLERRLTERVTVYVREQTGDPMLHATELILPKRNANYLAEADSEIEVSTRTPIEPGRQRFLISFSTPYGPVRFPVYAAVRQATPVVVAAAPIARGAVITAASVRLAPLPAGTRLAPNETPYADLESVVGQEAGQAIRGGQPLSDLNCLPPLLVRRGEYVSVVSGGAGLRVTLQAKARKNARLGEMTEVETLDGKTRLDARVVGRGELAVISAGGSALGSLSSAPGTRRFR